MPQDPVTVYEVATGLPAVMFGVDAAEAVRSGAYQWMPLEGVELTDAELAAARARLRGYGAPVPSATDWWMDTTPQTMGAAEMHYGDLMASRDMMNAAAMDLLTSPPVHALPTDTPVNAVASTLTTALAGANNDLLYTAQTKGELGDTITIAYVNPAAASQALAVTVTGTAISVSLATNGGSAITSTATLVKAAIEASAPATALVAVANAGGNDGTGVVPALAATPLAGGVDGTIGFAGQERVDAAYRYSCIADNDESGANWRRVAWSAVY